MKTVLFIAFVAALLGLVLSMVAFYKLVVKKTE